MIRIGLATALWMVAPPDSEAVNRALLLLSVLVVIRKKFKIQEMKNVAHATNFQHGRPLAPL